MGLLRLQRLVRLLRHGLLGLLLRRRLLPPLLPRLMLPLLLLLLPPVSDQSSEAGGLHGLDEMDLFGSEYDAGGSEQCCLVACAADGGATPQYVHSPSHDDDGDAGLVVAEGQQVPIHADCQAIVPYRAAGVAAVPHAPPTAGHKTWAVKTTPDMARPLSESRSEMQPGALRMQRDNFSVRLLGAGDSHSFLQQIGARLAALCNGGLRW